MIVFCFALSFKYQEYTIYVTVINPSCFNFICILELMLNIDLTGFDFNIVIYMLV